MADEDRRRVRLAVAADDSYLGRAQRLGLAPAPIPLRLVVASRRAEIAQLAHVKAACLVDRPTGDSAKALHEAVGDVAFRELMSRIKPADIEGVRPSLQVFVSAEVREIHSVESPVRQARQVAGQLFFEDRASPFNTTCRFSGHALTGCRPPANRRRARRAAERSSRGCAETPRSSTTNQNSAGQPVDTRQPMAS